MDRLRYCFPAVLYSWNSRNARLAISYSTILETYSLEDLLELNDITEEEALDYLVTQGFLELPEIKPLDFDEPS